MNPADSPGDLTRPHTHTQVCTTDRSEPSRPALHVARARGFQNETDPHQKLHDALIEHGCKPHGPLHQYRAQCPAHDSNSPSLSVGTGADGRALLHCNVGCETQAIVDALGLTWSDLFPPGHRHARRLKPRPVKTLTRGAAFLDMLAVAGYRWAAQVFNTTCPYCQSSHAYLTVHDRGGLDVNCPEGCSVDDVRRAVEARAAIREKGLQL